jgi:hypothetical protein
MTPDKVGIDAIRSACSVGSTEPVRKKRGREDEGAALAGVSVR